MGQQRKAVFDHLNHLLSETTSLAYLCFPPSVEHDLRAEEKVIVEKLKANGVSIYYDGNLGYSMVPDSFFSHLDTQEREQ